MCAQTLGDRVERAIDRVRVGCKLALGEYRAEAEAYKRCLEEGLGCHPDLEWAGIMVHGEEEHSGECPYTVLVFSTGAVTLRGLPAVAQAAARRKRYDVVDYDVDVKRYGVSPADAMACYNGTFLLADAYRRIYQEERRRASLPLHHTLFEAVPTEPVSEVVLPSFQIPPRIEWVHACNELMGEPVYHPLPQLDEAWSTVKTLVEQARDGHDFKLVGTKSAKLPSPIVPDSLTVARHLQYGELGDAGLTIREGFRCQVDAHKEYELAATSSVAIGRHIPAMLPRWNRRDPHTIAMGACYRIGREPVPASMLQREVLREHIDAAVAWLIQELEKRGLQPQNITPEMSFSYVASSRFQPSKKGKYLKEYASVIDPAGFKDASEFSNEHAAQAKNECYLSGNKAQRLILAGSYQMAAVLAPACAILGNYFFSMKYTSKKIPERERPRIAMERFPGQVILNDMSAYEGSITEEIKTAIEHRILEHFFPNIAPWIRRCNEPIDFWLQGCHVQAPTMRCSGDPQTSLGNSLTNLVSILAAYKYSHPDGSFEDVVCWVEGDDSLVAVPPQWGDNAAARLLRYQDAFRMMGFSPKMEFQDFVGDAGYCSMFFDREGHLCPRVAQTFLDFSWNHSGNAGRGVELLTMKACAIHTTCPSQPLTWALARHFSRDIAVTAVLPYNSYEYEEFLREGYRVELAGQTMRVSVKAETYGRVPTEEERELFFRKYGISPREQEAVEASILKWGPEGIIRNFNYGRSWDILARLCRVDGIDLHACRHYYSLATRCEQTTPAVMMPRATYSRGSNGKVEITGVRKRVMGAWHRPKPGAEMRPIDPMTYHLDRLRKIRERRRCLWRTEKPYRFVVRALDRPIAAVLGLLWPAILLVLFLAFACGATAGLVGVKPPTPLLRCGLWLVNRHQH